MSSTVERSDDMEENKKEKESLPAVIQRLLRAYDLQCRKWEARKKEIIRQREMNWIEMMQAFVLFLHSAFKTIFSNVFLCFQNSSSIKEKKERGEERCE